MLPRRQMTPADAEASGFRDEIGLVFFVTKQSRAHGVEGGFHVREHPLDREHMLDKTVI